MNKIKEYREAKGMTQKGLAEALGVKDVTIARYETNARNPKLEQLKKIATVLECSYLDLIDDDEMINEWMKSTLARLKSSGRIYKYTIDYDRKVIDVNFNMNHGVLVSFDNFRSVIRKKVITYNDDIVLEAFKNFYNDV